MMRRDEIRHQTAEMRREGVFAGAESQSASAFTEVMVG